MPTTSLQHSATREVQAILAVRDPVQRNLRITLGYHDLTVGMTDLIGTDDIAWTGFATWASKTAGRFVRGEYLPRAAYRQVDRYARVHRRIRRAGCASGILRCTERPAPLVRLFERVCTTVSTSAMEGNLSVFADIAPVFAAMIDEFRGARSYDQAAIDRFVGRLQPGPTEEGGRDLLITAFRAYYEAMFEPSRKRRAELVLLANNLVGFHEQIRLQRYIVACLNAPVLGLLSDEEAPHELPSTLPVLATAAELGLGPVSSRLQREWARLATRVLMRMELPDVTLNLGDDLPHYQGPGMFPEDLRTIEHRDLRALLYQVDRTPNTVSGSAAKDWGDIAERMNFIVDLFRTRQQDGSLYRPPFTDEQIRLIRTHRIPSGRL